MPRDGLAFDFPPLRKNIFGERHGVSDIGFNQLPAGIVIGTLPVLLELFKRRDYADECLLKRRRIIFLLRGVSSISHWAVIEHPSQSRPLILELPVLDEILYEEMEDRVVGRGNGAAHV